MSHGTRGDFTDYRGKTIVQGRPNWRITVLDSGALPYFELPADFTLSSPLGATRDTTPRLRLTNSSSVISGSATHSPA
jgi:hypothetical protein